MHETAVPTVPVDGQVTETANANAAIVTVAVFVCELVGADESVPVTEIVSVPLVEYVVEKVAPVPDAGLPPVAVHAKV